MEQTAPDRQPLRAPLDEFTAALEQEITAAQANLSATAVALTDGKLVAPVGGAFHYTFDTLARVGVPPDTEGQLILPNRPDNPIDVRLVEIAELKVTLAVGTHIGRAVPSAKLQTDLTMLLKRLIARIEEKAQEGHSAADRVLGKRPPSGKPVTFTAIIPDLNKEQKQAVASTLGRDTTFVWGPPGTGKTHTIGEIGAQLFRLGKTLLIASHTNTAVDGAVLKIAEAFEWRFEEGDIVRIGDPVKAELREKDRTSDTKIIMRSIVEKRERLLKVRRDEAEQELDTTKKESGETQRLLEIAEWLFDAPDDITELEDRATRVSALVEEERTVSARLSVLVAQELQMRQLAAEAAGLLLPGRALSDLRRSLNAACGARDRHCNEKLVAEKRLNEATGRLDLSRSLEPLRERARKLPSPEVLQGMAQTAEKRCADTVQRIAGINGERLRADELLTRVRKLGAIKRMWLKLPKPEDQAAEVERLHLFANAAREELTEHERRAADYRRFEVEAREIERKLAPHLSVPDSTKQEQVVATCKTRIGEATAACNDAIERTRAAEGSVAQAEAASDAFVRKHGMTPQEGARRTDAYRSEKVALERMVTDAAAKRRDAALPLQEALRELLGVLAQWDIAEPISGTIPELLDRLRAAETQGKVKIAHTSLEQIRIDVNRLAAEAQCLQEEIKDIDERLKRIASDLIENARILATTLTRTYLRNDIQSRSFDTVLVDEVSMAPIPAVWVAATLAERAVVMIGDFLQLPPIVQSTEVLAKKWLGKDLFDVSGISGAWLRRQKMPRYFVGLREQHRMHPEISAIVNALVYDEWLRDGTTVTKAEADRDLLEWLSPDSTWTSPVLLLDTSQFGGWNTARDKSRCNPLSAFLVAQTVRQMLRIGRRKVRDGQPRILAISPYRPHARLLQLLLRDYGLEDDAVSSTVHSFQGSEADVVILDLVVDNPQFRTNITTPAANEEMRRLLNVAMTRARRRLVVVGNFDWLRKKGGNSFVAKDLLPFLIERHEPHLAHGLPALYQALDLFSESDCVFTAQAHLLLRTDIAQAHARVVIYSPSLAPHVIERMEKDLRDASDRLVVSVICSPVAEYPTGKQTEAAKAESVLARLGVRVVHKSQMQEKMVIIDDDIVWCGCRGALDAADPLRKLSGFRRESKKLATEISEIYQFDKLLEPYRLAPYLCPICGTEMLIAEASNGGNKFSTPKPYWRCGQKGCYTRSLDAPPVKDGKIALSCGHELELGEHGAKPHWICTCGKRHRKKVSKVDLRLPGMRELVPKGKWNALCRELGLTGLGP